ncbi:MAG: hypothetical protein Q4F28_07490 [Eubacteriales bacterium]|nr:hypothetical protein [Eubacteriales bacterium]
MKITEETMKQQNKPDTDRQTEPSADGAPSAAPKLTEREKLKSMDRRDRLWYIWAYYKFHIFGVILAVLTAGAIGHAMYNSTFTTELHCMVINNRSETELNTAPLEQDFASYLELGKKQKVTVESAFIGFGDDATEFSYASMAKISALVAAQSLDVVIGDTESINHYASISGFLDLETGLSPDTLGLVQDRLYYTTGEDGSKHAYAIDLSGTAFAGDTSLALDPPLLGVISNSAHSDTVERLIQYIFVP